MSAFKLNLSLVLILLALGIFVHGAFFLAAAVFIMILPACDVDKPEQ